MATDNPSRRIEDRLPTEPLDWEDPEVKHARESTRLANEMAAAGAAFLDHMGTGGALAAIPNTTPQQYVVAGTLAMIGKVLPAESSTAGAARQGGITSEAFEQIAESWDGCRYDMIDDIGAALREDFKRLATQAQAAAPATIDTPEFRALMAEHWKANGSVKANRAFHAVVRHIDSKLAHPAAAVEPKTVTQGMIDRALDACDSYPCPMNGSAARGLSREQMRAILEGALSGAAQVEPAAIPAGYVLVPVKATPAMEQVGKNMRPDSTIGIASIYCAMLAAAPSPAAAPAAVEQAEKCELRLCCRADQHAQGCTTYDPARYPDEFTAPSEQLAAPEQWTITKISDVFQANALRVMAPDGSAVTLRRDAPDPTETVLYRYFVRFIGAAAPTGKAQAEPVAYVSEIELAMLDKKYIATTRLYKQPGTGRVAIYLATPTESQGAARDAGGTGE